jgi:hypothetical protein
VIARDGRAHLVDFSLAAEQSGTEHPLLSSNVLTASPEYLAGSHYSQRADQFALGGLIYQLLVGSRPFKGADNRELRADIQSRHPLPPAALEPRADRVLSEIAMRLLEKDPLRRFERCARIAERLRGEPARPARGVSSRTSPANGDHPTPAAVAADRDTQPSLFQPTVQAEALGGPMVALLERARSIGPPVEGIRAAGVARVLAVRLKAGPRAELFAPLLVAVRELAARLRLSATSEPIASLMPLEAAALLGTVERLLTDPESAG